jgi:3-methyl-2-oxobutanoate hydroxymethyltransferase
MATYSKTNTDANPNTKTNTNINGSSSSSSRSSAATKSSSPVTLPDFALWKQQGRKISVLTAYDFTTARLLDGAGVDCLLVGDTLGMVVQGWDTTLRVTLDQMVYHAEMVARAARRALVVADLPFLSYQASPEQAILSAGRFLKETRCQAVKLEGGRRRAATIRALVEAEIPIMGHVGLTPQSVRKIGGYKVQRDAEAIVADAEAVAEAGAFALVLECVPADIAERISRSLPIPTIGIGAGAGCDGQVLVTADLLGLFDDFRPRFVRRYAELGELIRKAAAEYVSDVAAGRFPSDQESFH